MSTRILPGDPFQTLNRHKDIIKEAARLTMSSASSCGGNMSCDQQIYWSMCLTRHHQDSQSHVYRRALRSYPYLAEFVDSSSGFVNLVALSRHISVLEYNRGLKAISDGPREAEEHNVYKQRMNRLSQYLSLWASKRRKVTQLSIIKPNGEISSSSEDASLALSNYWAPRLAETPVSLALARVALDGHIACCPSDIDPVVPFDQYEDRVNSLIDSGVGTDTLLYSCWQYCHPAARLALYACYMFLLDHALPDVSFLLSRLIFIQKGKDEGDQGGACRRHPKKTRPLNLANTDCKILSCLVSIVLTLVCSACIQSRQAGGMKGNQMIDHIFELEAKIFEFVSRRLPSSGVFALDIAAAFPSLSRKYLFWVLKKMCVPRRLLNIIRQLHRVSSAYICFRNRLFQLILISTGVKQGDPAAMQLYILGYDPLIRFIDTALAPVDHILLPYCDDLGIACTNVLTAWSIIMRCFVIIEKISALHLNNDKTQFLLTSITTSSLDIVGICDIDRLVSPSQFQRAIKYLGILLGDDAIALNWSNVCPEFIDTARFIGSLDCGMVTKVSLYNMLAISKLSFVASFFQPDKSALRAENRAIQLLTRGPWNAMPPSMMKALKSIGLPTQIRDLKALSTASKIRVAASTSQTVFARNLEIENIQNSCDVVCSCLDEKLLRSTSVHSIVSAYQTFTASHSSCLVPESSTQAQIYNALVEDHPSFDFITFLTRKLTRYFEVGSFEHSVEHLLLSYKYCSHNCSFAMTLTHLRAICNHWCTASRFGNKRHACQFGCGHHTDQLAHSICCPKFWHIFRCILHSPDFPFEPENILLLSDGSTIDDKDRCNITLLGTHICFLCFNYCRHNGPLTRRVVLHHLYHFSKTHSKVRLLVRRFRCRR